MVYSIGIVYQMNVVLMIALQRENIHKSISNTKTIFKSYDYIVVGAGSAGCVVARRLSDERHSTVLLLEAGGPQKFFNDLPGYEQTFIQTMLTTGEANWNYETFPQKRIGLGLARPGVYPEPKGRVMGGSSTINRLIYSRPNRRDFDEWEHKYGAKDWSFSDVLPYFVKSENNSDYNIVAQNPGYHGMDGPMRVSSDPNLNLFLRKVQKGYNTIGIPTVDLNGPQQTGSAIMQSTRSEDGFRSSTSSAYLEPNPNPHNLFISTNSLATRILSSNDKTGKIIATGVQFIKNRHNYKVRARKEVIISAGSYGSPQLLMLSGIGPEEHLHQMGIPSLVNLTVGDNLQDHPMVHFWAPILNNTNLEVFPKLTFSQLYELICKNEGPLSASTALYTYFSTQSNKDKEWPNIVFSTRISKFSSNIKDLVDLYSTKMTQKWVQYFMPYLGMPYLALNIFLRKPKSKGTVRLNSANPYDPPIIDPNFLSYETEMEAMVEALKFELYFVQNSKISENVFLISKGIPGCTLCTDRPIYECDDYIRCYIIEIGDKEHHSCGTCRMGDPHRPDTVVDPRLRVKHVESLRVCDASVMPHIPNSNTHAVTVMIGERCAHFIQQENQ